MVDKPRNGGDVETLLRYLEYDDETGNVSFKQPLISRNGKIISVRLSRGYYCINYKGVRYALHRLIFRLKGMTIPDIVDHKNLNKLDNRWCNLRVATKRQNNTNQPIRKDNTSGFKGVRYDKRRKLWYTTITVNYKTKFLGYFKRAEEAAVVYDQAADAYHEGFGWRNTYV